MGLRDMINTSNNIGLDSDLTSLEDFLRELATSCNTTIEGIINSIKDR